MITLVILGSTGTPPGATLASKISFIDGFWDPIWDHFGTFWVSRDGFLEQFWKVLGDLGVTFCGLHGCRNLVDGSSKFRGSPGKAQIEGDTPGRGDRFIQWLAGNQKGRYNPRLPKSEWLEQTPGLEGTEDRQL